MVKYGNLIFFHIIGKNRIRKNENKDIGIKLYFRQEILKVVASVTEVNWKKREGRRMRGNRQERKKVKMAPGV